MAKILKRAAILSLMVNLFLFIIKIVAAIFTNSIAVMSDAINSLTDIISSVALTYSVQVSMKTADEEHQFGHNAAQPIAVFFVALFAGVVGINVVEESIKRILSPEELKINIPVYVVLGITILAKLIMMRYQTSVGKEYKSPALKASAIDSLNDVLASSMAVLSLVAVQLGLPYIDGIAGILIAFFIFKSGYQIAKENIGYLMGKAADENLILEIANVALKIDGVRGLNEIKSHYVGNKFHIEIHIDVDKDVNTEQSHDIGLNVQKRILTLPEINKVFVHIDPV
jgi:cation diffusion facilitator family transporter